MSWCDCGCARELDRLQDQVRTLEHQLASLRYDLEREIDDRRSAIRSVRDEIGARLVTTTYNVDGEQYRVIIRGEHVSTFTDVEAACDAYADQACADCWRCRPGCCYRGCCTVQTWQRSRDCEAWA